MAIETLKETSVTTERLIKHTRERFPEGDLDLVKRACAFAEEHFAGLVHPTGQPYIRYAFSVAKLLADLGSTPTVICAAVVCPPPSVTGNIMDELRKMFKNEEELLELVDEVLHLGHLEWDVWPIAQDHNESRERKEILQKMFLLAIDEAKSEDQGQSSLTAAHFQKREKQAENLIRMFLAAATDIRALIIKLADRLLFMRLLKDVPPAQKESLRYKLLAKITLAIYAPLADRLGMWRLKSELEDMSFRLLEPEKYKAIADQLRAKKQEREDFITHIIPIILKKLEEWEIEKAEISGRAKHIYSIHRKMEAKQLTFEQINDLLGIRIVLETPQECYDAQGILHEYWSPITTVYDGKAGRDWIARPKENLYQSLHTTILIEDKAVEVQIRTRAMHEIAEYGPAAAHWRYKETKIYRKGKTPKVTKTKDQLFSERLAERRKNLEQELKPTTSEQKSLLKDWIFVITPEGHVIDLAAGATPLDFAYRIHTELGHRYAGAKVGGSLAHLDYELKNGEIVELLPPRTRKGPSLEWLSKNRLDEELKSKLDEELKSKLDEEPDHTSDDELEKRRLVDLLVFGIQEGLLPQWLDTSKKSKDQEDYMYYVFARTRQAREKIHSWFNKQKSKEQP